MLGTQQRRSILRTGALLLMLAFAGTVQGGDDFSITPLPLAKKAKAKPDEFPEQVVERKLNEIYVRANALLGERKYAELERMESEFWKQYQAGKISGDTYLNNVYRLVPAKAGKAALGDLLAWTASRSQSYLAWYVLGTLYREIAWQERGTRYARDTTPEQFRAMEEYAGKAIDALGRSLQLSEQPLASYEQLIRLVAIVSPKETLTLGTQLRQRQQGGCAWASTLANPRKFVWNEQLNYLCLALQIDPNAVKPFKGVVNFNVPRWGGDYETLDKLLAALEQEPRISAQSRAEMRSYVLEWKADDTPEADAHAAAELYLQAFEAAPSNEKVRLLYRAAYAEWKRAQNPDRALTLFRKITDFRPGEYNALFEVGWIAHQRGDTRTYIEQMILAGMLGKKEAQNNIGYSYMIGQRGLPKDLQEARKWLTLSANQGLEHAREKLVVLDDLLAAEQKKR